MHGAVVTLWPNNFFYSASKIEGRVPVSTLVKATFLTLPVKLRGEPWFPCLSKACNGLLTCHAGVLQALLVLFNHLGRFSTLARVRALTWRMPHMLIVSFVYPDHQACGWITKPSYTCFRDSPISRYQMTRCRLSSMEVHFLADPHVAQATLQLPEA